MADAASDLRALLTADGQALLAALPAYDPQAVIGLSARLRDAGYPESLVAAALTQARLRGRAGAKFGPQAQRMYFTEDGLAQATRAVVSAGHAARYARAGVARVWDLGCGIGGDLIALASAGLDAVGVERDPLTAAVAEANLAALGLAGAGRVMVADARSVEVPESDGLFLDPARRSGGRRTFDPRAYQPSYDEVVALAGRIAATGAKLAPGIPHTVLPADAEAEWVSVDRDVVECALWWGPLSSGVARRATLHPGGHTITGSGSVRAPVGPVGAYLHEPDGAVIRAGLVAEVAALTGGWLLDPEIAYLSTEQPVRSPFFTSYAVIDVMPFGLKRLRSALRARGVGPLTVKKRGTAVEPETLRRQLKLTGDVPATVVLTRVAGQHSVLLVEPHTPRP